MNISLNNLRTSNLLKGNILILCVIFAAIMTGLLIADGDLLYVGVIFIPLVIYISIIKPIVFPLGLYVALLPFEIFLVLTGEGRGPTLTKLLGILTIMVLLFKGIFEKKLTRPDNAVLWWISFMIYGILSILWAVEPERAFAQLPTYFGLLILYLVVSSYEFKKSEFDTIKWCAIGGGTVAAIMTIYNYIQNPNLRASLTGGTDHNFAAFNFLIPFAVSTSMMFGQNKIIKQTLCWITSGVILFGIIVTGSRGGFLGAVVIFIVNILYLKITLKQRIIIVIMIAIAGFIFLSYSPDFFAERWGEAIETGGSSRLSIWYIAYKSLEKYWAFGVGMENFYVALKEFGYHITYYNPGTGSHNLYLESIVQLGIVGFTLMIIAMVKHYQTMRPRFNFYNIDDVMLKASFWGILVSSIFLHTFLTKSFWLLWMMILMHKNISKNRL